jgi:FkbM family methyltransferase
MNIPYVLGSQLIRFLLHFGVVSKPLSLLSKVWLRHARIQSHLRTFRFDGVVDGGANIGEFAHLVRDVLPLAHLVCVEPHPKCADHLRRKGFEVVPYALWHSRATLTLSQPAAQSTSCTVLPISTPRSSWTVEAIRLDELPIKGKRILVKLDLQGAEVEAIKGMDNLWLRCEALLLEVSIGASGTYEVVRELLKQKGYCEYSTVNELESMGRVVEADKLWVRSGLLSSPRLG